MWRSAGATHNRSESNRDTLPGHSYATAAHTNPGSPNSDADPPIAHARAAHSYTYSPIAHATAVTCTSGC